MYLGRSNWKPSGIIRDSWEKVKISTFTGIWKKLIPTLTDDLKSSRLQWRDFPGGPVVKNPSSNAEDVGSLPSQRTKIPHVTGQLSPHATIRENPHAATKTQHSQNFFKKGSNNNCGGNSKRTKIRSGAWRCKWTAAISMIKSEQMRSCFS